VLATIGHINSNKQAEQVLRAIASDPVLRERCEYRLLGLVEPDEQARLTDLSDSLGLPPPRFTGWLEDDALRAEMAEVDVICCLRSPLLETGSASLVTAMRSARPVLVSDHGAYADVPRDLVMRCEPGNEAEAIVRHLRSLLEVEGLAAELGRRGRAYTFEANSAASYVNALLPAMEAATAAGPQISMARTLGGHLGRWGLTRNHPQAARTAGDLSQMLRWENKDAVA
jgi:glycosyltransferase involved in cell wall biosynthesis